MLRFGAAEAASIRQIPPPISELIKSKQQVCRPAIDENAQPNKIASNEQQESTIQSIQINVLAEYKSKE